LILVSSGNVISIDIPADFSARMLQCWFLFGMATRVGLCEDWVSASSSSSPLPFSIYVLYGKNTMESFRKQGCDAFF
jgi:hypothetical protein